MQIIKDFQDLFFAKRFKLDKDLTKKDYGSFLTAAPACKGSASYSCSAGSAAPRGPLSEQFSSGSFLTGRVLHVKNDDQN